MSEHVQTPSILRVIDEIDALANAARANGDNVADLMMRAAAVNLGMAVQILEGDYNAEKLDPDRRH